MTDGTGLFRPRLANRFLLVLPLLILLYALLSFLYLDRHPDIGISHRLAEVTDVVPGGPADQAGIRVGDRIVAQNGVSIDETVRLIRESALFRPGDRVTYTISRDEKESEISLLLVPLSKHERLRYAMRSLAGI